MQFRCFGKGLEEDVVARSMAVIGAGTMGVGIAYVFAAADWDVTIVEPDETRAVETSRELADAAAVGMRRGVLKEAIGTRLATDVHRVADIAALTAGLDLIIESVPERMELKQLVLSAAEERRPALLASNTSSLSIEELASSLHRPEIFIGMHFFNPVWSISLVEVVRGRATSDDTLSAVLDIVLDIGKQSAVVIDSPGFATSRLDLIASMEAIRMVEEGVGSPADIDRAMQVAYRHPVGPLYLSDLVGLDVRLDIARRLSVALGHRFEPPRLLIEMVAEGLLGRKTGKGFYEWN